MTITVGATVRVFDPRTLGVIRWGTVLKVGRKWVTVDLGLTGIVRVTMRDVVEVVSP